MQALGRVAYAPRAPGFKADLGRRRRPALSQWLICGYAFLLPIQFSGFGSLRLAPSDVLIAAYALLRLSSLGQVRRAWSIWQVAVVGVVWFAMVTALWRNGSVEQSSVLAKALGIVILMIGYACLVDFLTSTQRLQLLLRWFVFGALVNAAVALAVFALNTGAGIVVPLVNELYPTSRLAGLLIDPNAFGGLLATALALHLITASSRVPLLTGWSSRLADFVLPLALALTFSRSAWIGLALATLGVATVRPRMLATTVRRLWLPVVVGLLLLVNLPGAGDLASRPGQVTARLSIGQQAYDELLRSPLLGMGLGSFESTHGVVVHNTFLWFLTEMGVVGAFAFGAWMVALVRRALRVIHGRPGGDATLAVALLAGFLVGLGVSIGIEAFYQRSWWLMFAGIGSLYARAATRR